MASNEFGNPLLKEELFSGGYGEQGMTRAGTAVKTALFLAVLLATASYSWSAFMSAIGNFNLSHLQTVKVGEDEKGKPVSEVRVVDPKTGEYSKVPEFDLSKVNSLALIGVLGAFFVGLFIQFNPQTCSSLGFVYAALEGLGIGAVSARFELEFPGIVLQAGAGTMLIAVIMWFLFAAGIIKVTNKYVGFVLAMMLGIISMYLLDIGMSLFGFGNLDIVHGNSWASIAVSGFIVFIAALNFAIDYNQIEEGVQNRASKDMEWYAAFALMLSIVWCYIEVIRLLAKVRSKDND